MKKLKKLSLKKEIEREAEALEVAEDENTAYMSTARSLKVDRGYYYRVHCNHIAGNEYPYEEDASFTDGILIP